MELEIVTSPKTSKTDPPTRPKKYSREKPPPPAQIAHFIRTLSLKAPRFLWMFQKINIFAFHKFNITFHFQILYPSPTCL